MSTQPKLTTYYPHLGRPNLNRLTYCPHLGRFNLNGLTLLSSFRSTQPKLTTYYPHLSRLNLNESIPAQHTFILMETTRLKYDLVFINLT
jgi:hypothetical protein